MANFRSFWEMTYFATHQGKWVWSLFEDPLVNTKQRKTCFRWRGEELNPPIGNMITKKARYF